MKSDDGCVLSTRARDTSSVDASSRISQKHNENNDNDKDDEDDEHEGCICISDVVLRKRSSRDRYETADGTKVANLGRTASKDLQRCKSSRRFDRRPFVSVFTQ